MTRIFVQRGSVGSSSNANRPSSLSAPQPSKEEEKAKDVLEDSGDIVEIHGTSEDKTVKNAEAFHESSNFEGGRVTNRADECLDKEHSVSAEGADSGAQTRDSVGSGLGSSRVVTTGGSYPPPPPVPPPRPSSLHTNVRRMGPSRRSPVWSVSGSRPTSPRAYGEGEGYNSADEQSPCYGSAYDDAEKERMFEHEIRRTRGYEVKRMLEDGNCLFRAVADQVYGDPEVYDMVRQMCIDYMERERDHFSQFITEGFTSYCKRKRRDKVYGNNAEIQAFAEMYNRPIHIFCYSTEPINIFHGNYNTDTPPIRLSYHHGNHYNSLVDPSRLAIGAGLGFSSLQGANIDRDRVKAVIRAQQDQQIDNALIAEGRFYSDLELTEKEMERMVMEASRTEYLAEEKLKLQLGSSESSTSGAEPSSSGTRFTEGRKDKEQQQDTVLSSSMQMLLSMGFSYLQVVEAYSIFGDDVDSMVCYLLEMGRGGSSSRRKGKAAE